MAKEDKSCKKCWQYSKYCEKCNLGWCYWFTSGKSPACAEDCEAFNPFNQIRNNRNENEEIFPKVCEFYDFLLGLSVPEGFTLKHKPKLSAEEAFSVIYLLQEHLHILPDSFEKCDGCDELFDSDREGYYLDDQYELKGRTLPKKYWGNWCYDCVPDVVFNLK